MWRESPGRLAVKTALRFPRTFYFPIRDIAADSSGNIYIADTGNNAIRL